MLRPQPPGKQATDRTVAGQLNEAVGLAEAIALEVIGARTLPLRRIRPATLFGTGVVQEIASQVADQEIALVIVDAPVSPIQQRNLERGWGCKVIDRTGLILEIFGDRASTREGRLQVELAALTYQRSRLVRSWTHLERQRGGYGFLGGPGESQIELDRRRIDDRITRIRLALEQVKRTRGLHREARQRVPYPVVALVGYTNAGKSTLFNRLTGASVGARDQLFATLDPTMRQLALPGGRRAILSDTVGFVADLPTDLVAAFRATLEEVRSADLVVHVRDIAHPETEAQRRDVLDVLASLGLAELADDGRLLEFWNKLDLLEACPAAELAGATDRHADVVAGSALRGTGLETLVAAIEARLAARAQVIDVELDSADGAGLAWLYRHGTVLERCDDGARTRLRVAVEGSERARFERQFGAAGQAADQSPNGPRISLGQR